MNTLQKRIGYAGALEPILSNVCTDYQIGAFQSYTVESMGYEDFNLRIQTTRDSYFIKIFSKFRQRPECERYVSVILKAHDAGVSQPEIYQSPQGYLYVTQVDGITLRLSVMEYITGENLVGLKRALTGQEIDFLIQQAAVINTIPIRPEPVYDSWAISNFLQESEKKLQYVSPGDYSLIYPLIKSFEKLTIESLPHCFVHGDLSKANIIQGKNKQLYIVDFGVSNYYPRIVELAMLFCETFFMPTDLDSFKTLYTHVIKEYQKYILLTKIELKTLPLFIQVGHAMHILATSFEEKVNQNETLENTYFRRLARVGLSFTRKQFA